MTNLDILPPATILFVINVALLQIYSELKIDCNKLRIWRSFHDIVIPRLLEFAKHAGVAVRFVSDADWAAVHSTGFLMPDGKKYQFLTDSRDAAGTYHHFTKTIRIREGFDKRAWTLAHELGHHVAITFRGDFSERGADDAAIEIFNQILTEEEKDLLEDFVSSIMLCTYNKE